MRKPWRQVVGATLGTSFALLALVLIMGLAMLGVRPVIAQVNTAGLSGVVLDPQGAKVPDATVTVKNLSTAATRNTRSDQVGRYLLVGLPPGKYELTVKVPDF